MTDFEEPPAKLTKRNDSGLMDRSMEEAQEEWLSEGVLTDDDLVPMDQDKADTASQDSAIQSLSPSATNDLQSLVTDEAIKIQTKSASYFNSDRMKAKIEELDEFLLRNDADGNTKGKKMKQSLVNDYLSDTDDLLRILGDDVADTSKRTSTLHANNSKNDSLSDHLTEGVDTKKRCKVTEDSLINCIMNIEDESDTDCSSEDMESQKAVSRPSQAKKLGKNSKKSANKPSKAAKNVTPGSDTTGDISKIHPNKTATTNTALTKAATTKTAPTKTATTKTAPSNAGRVSNDISTDDLYDEDINEAEFLEDDDFELDEKMCAVSESSESEAERSRAQVLRRPERMDEEMPTDDDSEHSDYSLFDELPSSESEDTDEWFSLDMRTERAADYIPLLGERARSLLSAERKHAADKVETFRRELTKLSNTTKTQAMDLETTRKRLIELDDLLSRT